MDVILKPVITRTAQLKPGDLFFASDNNEMTVCLLVTDPTENGERSIVLLARKSQEGLSCPLMVRSFDTTVLSFGNQYTLQLPSQPSGWLTEEPSTNMSCLVVNDAGVFLRVGYYLPYHSPSNLKRCYIDLQNGEIKTSNDAYAAPSGIKAFAVEWEVLTKENKPRSILSFPGRAVSVALPSK